MTLPARPAIRPGAAGRSVAQLEGDPPRRLYRGRNPARAVAIEDLRAMAHRRLPRFALEYLEGGAGSEASLDANIAAFARRRFVRRALVDVAERDCGTDLFGKRAEMPLAVAPTGMNGVFWRDGDCRLARAAKRAGVPFAQSTMSNDAIEDVARAIDGGRHWFQLYVVDPPEITEGLVARARDAGCEALIVNTDAQIFGKRGWSKRLRSSPDRLRARAIADAALHPRWLATTLWPRGVPRFGNFLDVLPAGKRGLFASAFWIRHHMDKALDWDRLKRLRDGWRGIFAVKGILAPADAARAAAMGADAVMLSNHGGRELDWSVAALDMVEAVRAAVGDRLVVTVDGGVRTGDDIAKAVAAGADAVLAGRAPLYGLAAAGEAGAGRALDILHDELDLCLGLLGCPGIGELGPDYLAEAQR